MNISNLNLKYTWEWNKIRQANKGDIIVISSSAFLVSFVNDYPLYVEILRAKLSGSMIAKSDEYPIKTNDIQRYYLNLIKKKKTYKSRRLCTQCAAVRTWCLLITTPAHK